MVLPERERVGLDSRIKEPDLECVVADRAALTDQLVEPLPSDDPLAIGVDIRTVAVAGWRPIYRDPISNRMRFWPG
jgi:hypothetical protein